MKYEAGPMTQLEAEIWIQNMENHFGSNLISRKYEVEHALQYFTQSAAIWWKMHQAIQGFSGAETWDEFKNTVLRSRLIQKCYVNPEKKTCACKICGEEGHFSKECTKESHKYLGDFPTEKVEFDPLEIDELAKMKESGKKKKYPRKGQISADKDLSHMTTLYESFLKGPETIMTLISDHDYPKILKDMMKHIHLEGDAVYKGYLFMENGVEL
ncbi:hypothetical protein D1007_06541 [Hordeum vulgare]|nr:hypothetical protein D1007_06541 [Hordeum vulgare]